MFKLLLKLNHLTQIVLDMNLVGFSLSLSLLFILLVQTTDNNVGFEGENVCVCVCVFFFLGSFLEERNPGRG
jgi:hypothetical protein